MEINVTEVMVSLSLIGSLAMFAVMIQSLKLRDAAFRREKEKGRLLEYSEGNVHMLTEALRHQEIKYTETAKERNLVLEGLFKELCQYKTACEALQAEIRNWRERPDKLSK